MDCIAHHVWLSLTNKMSPLACRHLTGFRLASLVVLASMGHAFAKDDGFELASKAHAILEQHCAKCHGEHGGSHTDDMVIERTAMVKVQKVLKPGNPEQSLMLQRITSTDEPMPPDGKGTRLDPNEIKTIKDWILANAPDWKLAPRPVREFVPIGTIISVIEADVRKAKAIDRPFLRYFTLTHLYNANTSDEEIIAIGRPRRVHGSFPPTPACARRDRRLSMATASVCSFIT